MRLQGKIQERAMDGKKIGQKRPIVFSLVPYFLDYPFKYHTIDQVVVERRIYHYTKSPYGAIRDVFVSDCCSQDQWTETMFQLLSSVNWWYGVMIDFEHTLSSIRALNPNCKVFVFLLPGNERPCPKAWKRDTLASSSDWLRWWGKQGWPCPRSGRMRAAKFRGTFRRAWSVFASFGSHIDC